VHGAGVVERTDGANRVDGGAPGGNVSEGPTVLALRVPIRGVGSFDRPRTGEEVYRGTHDWDVSWMDRDDDGGGSLVLPRPSVGVEKPGGEDAYVFGVEDRLREARKELIRVFGEERDGEGVNGELGFVGGEAGGQPGGLTHREGLVELGRESVEVRCEGGSGGGRVGDEKGD